MTYFTEKLMRENQKNSKFIEDFQLGVNLFPEAPGRTGHAGNEQRGLNQSVWDLRKQPKPNFKSSFNLQDRCFKKGNPEAKISSGSSAFQMVSPGHLNKKLSKFGKL